LQKLSLNTSGTSNSVSIYSGELTTITIIEQVKRLKLAFPNAGAGFFDLVMDRVKEKKFSDQRLKDAVNNLIDNHRYPNPLVSDVVSFDRRAKLHTHSQVCDKVSDGFKWDDFEFRKMEGRNLWVLKSDIIF